MICIKSFHGLPFHRRGRDVIAVMNVTKHGEVTMCVMLTVGGGEAGRNARARPLSRVFWIWRPDKTSQTRLNPHATSHFRLQAGASKTCNNTCDNTCKLPSASSLAAALFVSYHLPHLEARHQSSDRPWSYFAHCSHGFDASPRPRS